MNRPHGFLLGHAGPISNFWPGHEIGDREPDEIIAPELAVDCQINKARFLVRFWRSRKNRIAQIYFWLNGRFGLTDLGAEIRRHALLSCLIKM